MPAAMRPMISTTTISSMSVKPRWAERWRRLVDVWPWLHRALLRFIPVSDVGGRAITAGLPICAQGEEVVVRAVGARGHVLIFAAPGVLADFLGKVTARPPVADRWIRWL